MIRFKTYCPVLSLPVRLGKRRLHQHRVGRRAVAADAEIGRDKDHLAAPLHRRIALGAQQNRLIQRNARGFRRRDIHQCPEGGVINNPGNRLPLADVIAELHRVEIANLSIDGRGDVLVSQSGGIGAHPLGTLNRLGDVSIPLFGGNSALFIQKDVALGIKAVLARFSLGRIQCRGLLDVVEHQNWLARFHLLPLLHQDLHDPAIGLGPERDIGGRAQATDDINLWIELSRTNRLDLNSRRLALGLLGPTAHQQQQQRQRSQQAPHDSDSGIRNLWMLKGSVPRMMEIDTSFGAA